MSNAILDYMREDDIKYDPWGTAMNAGFAVCETMHLRGDDIPAEWGFSPGLVIEYDEDYIVGEYGYLGEIAIETYSDDLLYAGRVIHHYLNLCRKAGKDY